MKVGSHKTPNKFIFQHPPNRAPPSLMLSFFLLLQNAAFLKEQNHTNTAMPGQSDPLHYNSGESLSHGALFMK